MKCTCPGRRQQGTPLVEEQQGQRRWFVASGPRGRSHTVARAVSLEELRSETPRGELGGHRMALPLPLRAPTPRARLPPRAGMQDGSGAKARGSRPRCRHALLGSALRTAHSASELHCLRLPPRSPCGPHRPPLVAGSPASPSQTLAVRLWKQTRTGCAQQAEHTLPPRK